VSELSSKFVGEGMLKIGFVSKAGNAGGSGGGASTSGSFGGGGGMSSVCMFGASPIVFAILQ
jgi:hypothetical protein